MFLSFPFKISYNYSICNVLFVDYLNFSFTCKCVTEINCAWWLRSLGLMKMGDWWGTSGPAYLPSTYLLPSPPLFCMLTLLWTASILLWEVNLRTWMNRRWEWIILSVRSLTVFEENIVVTVLAKLVPLFFKCSYAFFFTYALSNWQVSDSDRCL